MKCKSEESRVCFKIQRNLRKAKRDYYENLELGKVNDSKKFWNAVKPIFGNKVTTRGNITLIENEKVVTSEIELYLIIVSPLVFFRNVLKLLKSSLHIRRANL